MHHLMRSDHCAARAIRAREMLQNLYDDIDCFLHMTAEVKDDIELLVSHI